MKVYTAHVRTESGDHYIWVYKNEPTRAEVIERLYDSEQAADLEWYEDTTAVHIEEQELIEND
jgi:hypothetical protein